MPSIKSGSTKKSAMKSVIDQLQANLRRLFSGTSSEKRKPEVNGLNQIKKLLHSLETVSADAYHKESFQNHQIISTLPKKMGEIEINDSCNLNCSMCQTALSTRQKGLMNLALFEETVKASVAAGITRTNLHTIGDPLMNKKLRDYLTILRKYKLPVNALSTNGLLLERHLDLLFEYRDVIRSMRFSIDAVNPETYAKIRVGGNLKSLHENLIQFVTRNNQAENPYPIGINAVVSMDNYHEIAFIPMVFSYVTQPEKFTFHYISSLSPDNVYFNTKSCFPMQARSATPCDMLWNSIYTLKEGVLTCCCRDYNGDNVFGKIGEDSLEKLFNGPLIQSWRQAHLTGDFDRMPSACQTCYCVDPRLDQLLHAIIQYFYLDIRKHPVYLQSALDQMLPCLQAKDYGTVGKIVGL
ncbi:MAG: radical SAM protein [Magnetococcales bacterium]|nr:radical SAM protein [Magnetococcales bacterium]